MRKPKLAPGQGITYTFPRTGHRFYGRLVVEQGKTWHVVWDDLGKGIAPNEEWIKPA